MFDLVLKTVLAAIPSAMSLAHATLAKLWLTNSGPGVTAVPNHGPAATVTPPCTYRMEKESL